MILLKKRTKTIKEVVQLSEFTEWLIAEKDKRGWDDSMLAARAEVSPSIVSMVLSEQRNPGFDFCKGIARAFNEPPERILRLAGLLPVLPAGENSPWLDRLMTVVKRLSASDQIEVLRYAEFRNQITASSKEKEDLEKEELKAALSNLSPEAAAEWAEYLQDISQKRNPKKRTLPQSRAQLPQAVFLVSKETE